MKYVNFKNFQSILLTVFLLKIFLGCAAHTSYYETPLEEIVNNSNGNETDDWNPELISYDRIPNTTPGERPPIDSDEAGIWMVMDQAEERLKTSGHLVQNNKLNTYLQDIVCKLTPEYCKDIRIYVLRVPYFNAAMMPNGAMQIWTGLLVRVENEAQLASIIGHEIGHYIRRHSLQQMQGMINKTSALAFIQAVTALTGVGIVGDLATLVTLGSVAAFSRDQEREADGYGLALLSRAGYDPRESAKVWEQLMEELEASKVKTSSFVFLDTHPLPAERLEALKNLGERIADGKEQLTLNKDQLEDRIMFGRNEWLTDEIQLCDYGKTEKLLERLLANNTPDADLLFLKGEMYRLRDEEGDLEKALVSYERAMETAKPPVEMYRSMGLIYSKTGNDSKAVIFFRTYLDQCKECSDRDMIKYIIKGLNYEQ